MQMDGVQRLVSWPVRMALFVPSPSSEAVERARPFFSVSRPCRGSWLVSSADSLHSATLTISTPYSVDPQDKDHPHHAVLALILNGIIHEEHFVRNLEYTRPSFKVVSSDFQSEAVPGRVLFATYRRNAVNGSKHKFAVQFETVDEADKFWEILKHALGVDQENPEFVEYQATGSEVLTHKSTDQSTERTLWLSKVHQALPTACHDGDSLESTVTAPPDTAQSLLPPPFPPPELCEKINELCKHKGTSTSNTVELLGEEHLQEKIMACFLDPNFMGMCNSHFKVSWKGSFSICGQGREDLPSNGERAGK